MRAARGVYTRGFKLLAEEAWMRDAACKGEDADLFFPSKGDTTTAQQARGVCAGCPVRRDCLEFALRMHEKHGIWGGMNYKQRLRYVKLQNLFASIR